MTETPPAGPPPGWYNDDNGDERWWDGQGWGEQTKPAESQAAAPQSAAAGTRALDEAVAHLIAQGCTLETRSETQATLTYGRPVNNTLHAVLSIFTLGLWLIVWALVGMNGGVRARMIVTLDEAGEVHMQTLKHGRPVEAE